MIIILNQDHTRIHFLSSNDRIIIKPAVYEGELMGFNLTLHDDVIGTFYDAPEAIAEVERIHGRKEIVVPVRRISA